MVEYTNPYMGKYFDVGWGMVRFAKCVDYDTSTNHYLLFYRNGTYCVPEESMKTLRVVPYEEANLYEVLFGS